jgi:DNA-binding CsgD family transcriptional regulator
MEIEYLINRQTIKSVIDKKKLEGPNGIGSSTDEYEELINSYDHRIVNALTQYNGITPRDIKIACFLASGMDNNDLANIFNLSPHSIRIAKSRLKKKLNIGKEVDLLAWLNGLKTPLD